MMSISRRAAQATFSAALFLLAGCSAGTPQSARALAPGDVVATVGATSVTLAEVDERAMQMAVSGGARKLSEAIYEARRTVLSQMVDDLLVEQEAKARGVTIAALVEQEITTKVAVLSEDDIATWYRANQARLQGAGLDQLRPQIQVYLTQERTQAARQQYLDQLRAKGSVRILLDVPRQAVAAATYAAASTGPANAPIEMIEFSDFECPFCLRAHPTVKQVLATYGDKIRFVYRHYPLTSIHPRARAAAEASQCAAEQGQFWAYHDALFGGPSQLSDADLKARASQIGLNAPQFNACVDSRKFQADVDADIKAGDAVGVDGTPAFFINGRMLSGAQPFEAFKRIIDEELALTR